MPLQSQISLPSRPVITFKQEKYYALCSLCQLPSAPGSKSISTRAGLVLFTHYVQHAKSLFSHFALIKK